MVTEPQTIRDVWYMIETSSCNCLYYKNLCPFEDIEVGCHTDRCTNVEIGYNFEVIRVATYESQCVSLNRDKRSYSTQSLLIESEAFHSIEEFKNSAYWEDFLKRFKSGEPDSSWFDDVEIDHDEDGVIAIQCEVGVPRYDGLNSRYRIADRHKSMYLTLDNRYGTISIEVDGKEYYFTVRELTDMVDTFRLLEDNHITVDKYSGIKIPWAGQD